MAGGQCGASVAGKPVAGNTSPDSSPSHLLCECGRGREAAGDVGVLSNHPLCRATAAAESRCGGMFPALPLSRLQFLFSWLSQ
jgi:hypothetical protein